MKDKVKKQVEFEIIDMHHKSDLEKIYQYNNSK